MRDLFVFRLKADYSDRKKRANLDFIVDQTASAHGGHPAEFEGILRGEMVKNGS